MRNPIWPQCPYYLPVATSGHQRNTPLRRESRFRAQVEELESRMAPATFAVNAQLQVSRLDSLGDTPDEARAVVFFESAVADYCVLRLGLAEGTDAVVLDSAGDGLREMATFLTTRHDLTAIGLVAHGMPGVISLGSTMLDVASLDNYMRELMIVGAALRSGGELDLWSCEIATGQGGDTLVRGLTDATGARVAAADHVIGSAALGGTWQLDVRLGGARGDVPFAADALVTFRGVLGAWNSAASMAAARYGHTATLLTNGKVLVTGGLNSNYVSSSAYLSSAELYDPVSNIWTTAGSMAVARIYHTATVLGNGKVLVTGGNTFSGATSSAEVYDPIANSWSPAGSLAVARYGQTATLLANGKVLVTGGQNTTGAVLASGELFDPATNMWSTAGIMGAARVHFSATLLSNGRVLVTGGDDLQPFNYFSSTELYDPASNTWSTAAPLLNARSYHTATLLSNGKVLVTGGRNPIPLAVNEIYDSITNTWSPRDGLGLAREIHTATLLGNGQVVIIGGNNASSPLSSTELYNPLNDSWSATGPMATARVFHTATLLGNGKVLVVGGYGNSGILPSSELYESSLPNPPSAWSPAAPLLTGRTYHSATLLPTGNVLVTGGYGISNNELSSAELYFPASNAWSSAVSMATQRAFHTATLLGNGKVLVVGGFGNHAYLSSAELYDPLNNTWSSAGSISAARSVHTATLLGNGKVLVVGGQGNGGFLSSAEMYDPLSNIWSSAGSISAARSEHTATLLGNGKVLVAGGQGNGGVLSSAELYDPLSNTWSSAGSISAARSEHTATLLGNGKVLVAGGTSSSGYPSSAELYDPINNAWSSAGSLVTIRYQHTATLLGNGKVLVAGGAGGRFLNSAELYDPVSNTWTATESMFTGRHSHSATLLSNGKVLIAGGYNDSYLSRAELYDPNLSTFSKYLVSSLGGDTIVAGNPFLFSVQGADASGNPVSIYNGPTTVFTAIRPIDPLGNLPITGTLSSGGIGVFQGNIRSVGSYTLTTSAGGFTGTSDTITVVPAAANYFTVTAPPAATTGTAVSVTVKANDQFGNTATGYTGHVHFTSTDPAAMLPADATLTSGVGIFPVTLKTAGSQTITATDTISTAPTITGTSGAITTRGLTVGALTPTPTGFTVTFSKPIDPAKLTMFGPGATAQDVTLVGAAGGESISGTLIVDPTNTSATFKSTAIPLNFVNTVINGGTSSVVLPDGTYTVKLKSGAAGNGFYDLLGAGLDGLGNAGHADYTTTFTTHYQANKTPVLSVPDFARGPDDSQTIKVPNNTGHGIPITLYNAVGLTDALFTISFDPALLTNINGLGGAGSDATDPGSSFALVPTPGAPGTATFTFHSATPLSGNVVIGDILANVPSTAKTNYKAKELVQFVSATVNGAAFTGVTAPGVHVNSYFGDVSGDGAIGAADVNPMFSVAVGTSTGFGAYSLTDPTIVGDVAGDVSVDGGDVATLKSFILYFPRPVIPTPPGLTGIVSPNAVDPTLSLTGTFQANNGIVSVPVMLDHPRPEGSTGLTSAILALTYDPAVLSVSASDITFGSIPGPGSGWQLLPHIDQATGQIAIEMFGTTPLTSAQAGSLVNVNFHVMAGASATATAVQLVDSVRMSQQFYGTLLADAQGGWILSPGMDRLVIPTDVPPVVVPSVTSSLVTSAPNNSVVNDGPAKSMSEEPGEGSSLGLNSEANDVLVVMCNGAMAGDVAHGVSASLVVTGALAFQPSQPVAVTQVAGSIFQIGITPLVNPQVADRTFLVLFHGPDAQEDFKSLNLEQSIFWQTLGQDWVPTLVSAAGTNSSADTLERQATGGRYVEEHIAVVDKVFAQLADEMANLNE